MHKMELGFQVPLDGNVWEGFEIWCIKLQKSMHMQGGMLLMSGTVQAINKLYDEHIEQWQYNHLTVERVNIVQIRFVQSTTIVYTVYIL